MNNNITKKSESDVHDIQKRIVYADKFYQFTDVYFDKAGNVLAYDDLINSDMAEVAFSFITEKVSEDLEALIYELKINYSGLSLPPIDIEKERSKNKDIKAIKTAEDYFELMGITEESLKKMQQELLDFIESLKGEIKHE